MALSKSNETSQAQENVATAIALLVHWNFGHTGLVDHGDNTNQCSRYTKLYNNALITVSHLLVKFRSLLESFNWLGALIWLKSGAL